MNPAFSVIFLTVFIGTGQGLFVAVVAERFFQNNPDSIFALAGSLLALGFLVAGLVASFFHLGRPERAWRAVSQWKTSWLSREVIVMPLLMFCVAIYALAVYLPDQVPETLVGYIGGVGILLVFALFVCTAMIYASIRFLQEWASPWTLINFTFLGLSSGFLAAALLSDVTGQGDANILLKATLFCLLAAFGGRLYTFKRNGRLKPRSSIQSAIGIKHRDITQRSMGMTGGSFNTRAFFNHVSSGILSRIRQFVIVTAFVLPILLMVVHLFWPHPPILWVAFILLIIGLVAERWLFFAEANHPQNIYYQTIG